ncbi:hypothetical protein LP420_36565 [Massilia sp. B-10]|nr:hypothetical protein LP420_36565 [Massilia sp. B-10]
MKIKHGNALALTLLLMLSPGAALAAPADDIRELAATASRTAHHDSPYDEHDWLDRFYGKNGYAPVWKLSQRPRRGRPAQGCAGQRPVERRLQCRRPGRRRARRRHCRRHRRGADRSDAAFPGRPQGRPRAFRVPHHPARSAPVGLRSGRTAARGAGAKPPA